MHTCSCTICKTREASFPSKAAFRKGKATARCEYCKRRYDASGEPFILAANIYKFKRQGQIVYVWVCDGKVKSVKSNRLTELEDLVDQDKSLMMDFMKSKNFKFDYVSEAAFWYHIIHGIQILQSRIHWAVSSTKWTKHWSEKNWPEVLAGL